MAAPKGNRFWELRSSHGRNPIFADPAELWSACCQYFEWVEDTPLKEDKLVTFQGVAKHEPVEKMRAMTIDGLCLFLDIDPTTWRAYGAKEDFSRIVTRAEMVIRSQKFAGAAADLLNANIIARDLGLAERNEHSGPDGGPIETKSHTDIERAKAIALILHRGIEARKAENREASKEASDV